MRPFRLFLLLSSVVSVSAHAGWQGSLAFTDQERQQHALAIRTVVETASQCLDADLEKQRRTFSEFGVSPFYGSRSSFAKKSRQERFDQLYYIFRRQNRIPDEARSLANRFLNLMQPTSCVGLALKCLGQGFAAANEQGLWSRIRDYVDANDQDGTSLQNALQAIGWKILYWNPDTRQNENWDYAEQSRDPDNRLRFWGYHEYRWNGVQRNMMYYWNRVDDASTLVNFGTRVPSSFTRLPFFVGTAHTGYHVFPGHYGQVVEGHSTREITDSQTVQSAPFNPLMDGGAPRGQYFSGLMAVPPGL